jgi:DNA-binding transcriptional LysR family regulator
MQIESLKVFCDLSETQSFTKAAQINEVTQSAVSQTVSAMEKQFRALLVERSKKNFRLTPEGQMVYDSGKEILGAYAGLHNKLQELKEIISGTIRLSTVYSVGLHELPPFIQRFLKDFPHVNVHVEYRRANQVYEDVLGNVVDLGIVAYPTRDSKLELVPLRKDAMVLICNPQHPLAKLKSVPLKALTGQKFVGYERDIPTQRALDKIFREHGVTPQTVMEFDNVETIKRAVEIDSGIAIVPETTVQQEVKGRTLVAVGLENGNCVRPVGLIYKKNRVLSPAMKRFIELLKKPSPA